MAKVTVIGAGNVGATVANTAIPKMGKVFFAASLKNSLLFCKSFSFIVHLFFLINCMLLIDVVFGSRIAIVFTSFIAFPHSALQPPEHLPVQLLPQDDVHPDEHPVLHDEHPGLVLDPLQELEQPEQPLDSDDPEQELEQADEQCAVQSEQ